MSQEPISPGAPLLRDPLAARIARHLCEQLHSGWWTDVLPAERVLALELGVARNSLRSALEMLTAEGWLWPAAPPARRRIRRAGKRTPSARRIILFTPFQPEDLPGPVLKLEDDLRRLLTDQRYRLVARSSPAFQQRDPSHTLARLRATETDAIWMLLQAPAPIHAWFHEQRETCLVIGECYPELPLPCVTEDIGALARHAGGLLYRLGHRTAALLHRNPPRAGHLSAETGLASRSGLRLHRAGHTGSVEGVVRALESLFGRATEPTAIVATEPGPALTALTWFARRGLRVPEDVSIISLFHDQALESVLPSIAHYRTAPDALPRRLVESVRHLADGRPPPRHRPLIPVFIPGGSVGPPRALSQ